MGGHGLKLGRETNLCRKPCIPLLYKHQKRSPKPIKCQYWYKCDSNWHKHELRGDQQAVIVLSDAQRAPQGPRLRQAVALQPGVIGMVLLQELPELLCARLRSSAVQSQRPLRWHSEKTVKPPWTVGPGRGR